MTPVRAPTLAAAHAAAVANGLANRLLIPLLHGAAGRRLGDRLAVLEYVGRRSGLSYQLVTMYVTKGTTVRITVGMARHKTWWRNFSTPRPLHLRLAGVDHDAVAHVVREGDAGDRVTVVAELSPPAEVLRQAGAELRATGAVLSTTRERAEASTAVGAGWTRRVSQVVGGMLLAGAALNLVLTAVAPQTYADLGLWMTGPEPLHQLWSATMGDHPRIWVPIIGIGYEAAIGVLALSRYRRRRLLGLAGIALFHLGLLVMGLWWWALPMLAVVVPTIVRTVRAGRGDH